MKALAPVLPLQTHTSSHSLSFFSTSVLLDSNPMALIFRPLSLLPVSLPPCLPLPPSSPLFLPPIPPFSLCPCRSLARSPSLPPSIHPSLLPSLPSSLLLQYDKDVKAARRVALDPVSVSVFVYYESVPFSLSTVLEQRPTLCTLLRAVPCSRSLPRITVNCLRVKADENDLHVPRTHARTHTHTHARTHARTHTCTHAHTHARTHTHVWCMRVTVLEHMAVELRNSADPFLESR